jgi:hypothetical protein
MIRALLSLSLIAVALGACGGDPDYLPVEELMKPEACMECHPKHYQEWSGSMHAYASEDPVFLAMNQRGQEETNGALGDFCVKCHAPMALRLGLTTDGHELPQVPSWAKGVTCYFCHTVEDVTNTHNNPLVLAEDLTMRGGLRDPAGNGAHRATYSELHDGDSQQSSAMCGSCHDITTPAGVHLERTFQEWKDSLFGSTDPVQHLSCASCHMVGNTDVVADDPDANVPLRPSGRHEHTFAGIDVALTDWPEQEAQRAAIDRDLKNAISPRLCVVPLDGGRIDYRLDNIFVGHMWPSGAAQDRRAWAEVVAYDADGAVLFSSGVVPDGTDPEEIGDPNLWELRDFATKADGSSAHMFWDVAEVESSLLKPAVTRDPNDPLFDHSTTRQYLVLGLTPQIARVTAKVHIRPIGFDVLDDLVASGHLDSSVAAGVPTFTLSGTEMEWTPETADPASLCVFP